MSEFSMLQKNYIIISLFLKENKKKKPEKTQTVILHTDYKSLKK